MAEQRRVAVVVFCAVDADAGDESDAHYIAEVSVRHALRVGGTLGPLPVQPIFGDLADVQIHKVEALPTTGINGYLTLKATDSAYPREDETSG